MQKLVIETKNKKEVKDITNKVNELIKENDQEGVLNLFVTHTTTALTTADLDPGTDLDMIDAFNEIVPDLNYRHAHDPAHVPDHIMSSIIGMSLNIPYKDGSLILGSWQRVVLIEFDGPRDRSVIVSF